MIIFGKIEISSWGQPFSIILRIIYLFLEVCYAFMMGFMERWKREVGAIDFD